MGRIIIAGTESGVGKTTITMAIMRALTAKGVRVSPFKTGPDFIDPKFHTIACGTPSHNLDTVLNSVETVKYLFAKNYSPGSIAVIEGVMGLYDGCGFKSIGSTAELSIQLDAPVILVVNGKAASESICAVICGFKNYDRRVKIKGVILNNIHGDEFYRPMKNLIYEKSGIDCLGYVCSQKIPGLKERHLGLVPAEELSDIDGYIQSVSDSVMKSVDLDAVIRISGKNTSETDSHGISMPRSAVTTGLDVGIASDKAFNFYYEDNLKLMRETGINLVPFSPLKDKKLPDGIKSLYIGGGFPEIFAKELSENKYFMNDLLDKLENGMPCYAECGGLMYLTKFIRDISGDSYEMAGFFNAGSFMTGKLRRFGYVDVEYEGIVTKAHEFHYSSLEHEKERNFEFKYKVRKAFGDGEWQCGLSRKNVLAGYAHVHFYSNFEFYDKIMNLFTKISRG